jgi:DNA-binding LytR/AlgR family response regulator
MVHQTISYMEEQLPANQFLRIHRSFIIRMDQIDGWSTTNIDLPGKQLPIGRTYKKQVMNVVVPLTTENRISWPITGVSPV